MWSSTRSQAPASVASFHALVHRAGLHAERGIPITATYTDVHAADQVLGFDRVTKRAIEHGLMSEDHGRRWLGYLLQQSGPFFASTTLPVTVARHGHVR